MSGTEAIRNSCGQVCGRAWLAAAAIWDLLHAMSEKQANHVRAAVRSCGLCLTNETNDFMDYLCVCANTCVSVCVWEAGGGGGLGRMWNPGEVVRKEDRQVGWGEGEKDEDGKKSGRARGWLADTFGVLAAPARVCRTWNPTKHPQASELGACLHFMVRLRLLPQHNPQSMFVL